MADTENHHTPAGNRTDDKKGIFDNPKNVTLVKYALYIACALAAIGGFVIEKHPYFEIENIPVFYGLYGFAAFVFVVFAGKVLRMVVMRDEDYYDR